MVRKILAVILLSIGGLFVMCPFVMTGVFLTCFAGRVSAAEAVGMAVCLVFFVLAGGGLTVAGVALWNWRRRRMVLGVLLTVIGCDAATNAAAFILMPMSKEWELIGNPEAARMLQATTPGFLLLAAVALPVGLLLIQSQRRRDRATPLPPTPSSPPCA